MMKCCTCVCVSFLTYYLILHTDALPQYVYLWLNCQVETGESEAQKVVE